MAAQLPDPASIGLILGIAHVSKDAISDIVKRLFGPTADKAGNALAARFFDDRTERVTTVLETSIQMLRDIDARPQQVPGRILMPILEHCSWEDDPQLQRKWAALLANAASSGAGNKVLPGYVEILSQLTPVQAAILQWMFDMKTSTLSGHWPDVARKDIELKFGLSHSDYALLISDLHRLQLIEGRREEVESPLRTTRNFEDIVEQVVQVLNMRGHYELIAFTSLGVHFLAACGPPAASSANDRIDD